MPKSICGRQRVSLGMHVLICLIFASFCPNISPAQLVQKASPKSGKATDVFTEFEPGVRILGKPSPSAVLGPVLNFYNVSQDVFVVVSQDGVKLWNAAKNKIEKTHRFESPITTCHDFQVSQNKQLFALSTWSHATRNPNQPGRVLVLDNRLNVEAELVIDDEQKGNTYGLNQVKALKFSPDDRQLALSTWGGLKLIELDSLEAVHECNWPAGAPPPSRLMFRNDQIIGLGRKPRVLDLKNGKVVSLTDALKSLPQHSFSAYGEKSKKMFLSTSDGIKVAHLGDVDGKVEVKDIEAIGPSNNFLELYLSDDETTLGVVHMAEADPRKRTGELAFSVVDVEDLSLKHRIENLPGRPSQVRWGDSSQSVFFAFIMAAGFQKIKFEDGRVKQNPNFELNNPVVSVLLSADGSKLVTTFVNAKPAIWDWESGERSNCSAVTALIPSALPDSFFGISQRGMSFTLFDCDFEGGKARNVCDFSMQRKVAGPLTGFLIGMSDRPVGEPYYVLPSSISVNELKTEMHGVVLDDHHGIRIQTFEMPGYKRKREKLFKRKPTRMREGNSAITSDGKRFAINELGKLKVVEVESEQTLFEVEADKVEELIFAPNGKWLAMSTSNDVTVFETESGKQLKKINLSDPMIALAHQTSELLIVSKKKGAPVQLLETQNWTTVWEHSTETSNRETAAISHDGKRIVFGLSNCCFELWDVGKLKTK